MATFSLDSAASRPRHGSGRPARQTTQPEESPTDNKADLKARPRSPRRRESRLAPGVVPSPVDELFVRLVCSGDLPRGLSGVLRQVGGCLLCVSTAGRIEFQAGETGQILCDTERPVDEACLDDVLPELAGRIRTALQSGNDDHFEWMNPVSQRWMSEHICLTQSGATVFVFDVTDRHRLLQMSRRHRSRLRRHERYDAATGLLNRKSLQSRIEEACGAGERPAVVFIDLDGFRHANDAIGHAAGDLLLTQVARRLAACLGPEDVLARTGSDEFAVLRRCSAGGVPVKLLDSITESLRRPLAVEGGQVMLTASVGVAIGPDDGQNHDELCQAADLAMQLSKAKGGDCWTRFEPVMRTTVQMRHSIHEGLLQAIADNQLALVYQPAIRLQSGLVQGFEASPVWNHPVRGLLAASEFMNVAEERGLIGPLTDWSLLEACREVANWPSHCDVSVRLTPRQFRTGLVRTVSNALGDSRLEAKRLNLLIAESVLRENSTRNIDSLQKLRELGVQLVLDDIGAGRGSISDMQQFQFDRIKVGPSLIRGVHEIREKQLILRSIMALAAELRVGVMAAGVEHAEELRFLREAGCLLVQGNYIHRAAPKEAVLHYLQTYEIERGKRRPGQ